MIIKFIDFLFKLKFFKIQLSNKKYNSSKIFIFITPGQFGPIKEFFIIGN